MPILSQGNDYVGREIRTVLFVGLQNSNPDDLYPLLLSRIGQPLSEEAFNEDIRALFATGDFSSVEMLIRVNPDESLTIIFEVKEYPRIDQVEFLGADEIAIQDLRSVLPFRPGDVYNAQSAREGVSLLKDKYREEGFFLAEVWLRTGQISAQNEINLTYIVDEGENIPISRINILGARQLDPEDILDIMDQKEEGFLDSGTFKESTFEEDKFKILAYAKTNGFLDAEIDPRFTGYEIRWRNPARPEEGRVVIVTYRLIEGDIRYFGGYSLSHDPDALNEEYNPPERQISGPEDLSPIYAPEAILGTLEYNESDVGEIFDEGRYFRDRGFMQELYSREGYVFAQIRPEVFNYELSAATIARFEQCLQIAAPASTEDARCKEHAEWLDLAALRERLADEPDEEGHVLRHVHFTISENNLAYIENIIVKGMVKTQESVIRRELLVKEGQLFNSALVNRSRERLINLGYFKEVNLQMRPGSNDQQMNLIIDVKEQPTGTISMGGGYGTQSGFSIFTEVGENNLNGTGQRLTGRLEYGPLRRAVSVDWTEPWFYEACQDTTGSFWKNKLREVNRAPDLATIERVADSLRNEYDEIGRVIHSYITEVDGVENQRNLDFVKARIRLLLFRRVAEEEECYRSFPRPWSLRLGAFYSSSIFEVSPLRVSADPNDLFEEANFERNRFGLSIGTQHSFLINWAHYHVYSPSWSVASRPSALANDSVLQEVDLGWQFKSSLRNGIVYSTVDNVFTPTEGSDLNLELELVGQYLGGQDHFNRYTVSAKQYWWWFDYTLFGLFRSNYLRRWRVVQEVRVEGIFTHETSPGGGNQDKEKNAFIEPEDRLFLGGPTTLRGYDQIDDLYPLVWQDGANHMIYGGTELRIPIEPSIVWLAVFFDWGTLFDNIGEYNEADREFTEQYRDAQALQQLNSDPFLAYALDRADASTFFTRPYHFESLIDWNDPHRAVLDQRNFALDRTLYSWGFGLRIQIPVLPLRLYLAQKLYYAGGGRFRPIPGSDQFEFVFGIGDQRF